MKITKNSITASKQVDSKDKYDSAINYIQKAMAELSGYAKDDELAEEAITNLAVVLFDLRQ